MANPKHVAELPRFLLPRLTWSGKSLRLTASPLSGVIIGPKHQRAPLHRQPEHRRPTYTLHASPRYNYTLVGGYRRQLAIESKPVDAQAPPIRHNGVYVAAFKPARRAFHTTAVMKRDHHFDTLKFVQRLKEEGFSEEQAVAMMRVLNDVIEESIQNLTRTMVLREGLSKIVCFQGRCIDRDLLRRRTLDLYAKS